jgi:hypothetical protein
MASKEPVKVTSGSASDAPASNNKNFNRRGRGGKGNPTTQQGTPVTKKDDFKGGIAEMNGHIFQCHGEATEKNQYNRTMAELEVYVGAHMKRYSMDIRKMIRTMTDTVVEAPEEIDLALVNATTEAIWKAKLKRSMEREDAYEENKSALYAIIWSQCSEAMQSKLKSETNYVSARKRCNQSLNQRQITPTWM